MNKSSAVSYNTNGVFVTNQGFTPRFDQIQSNQIKEKGKNFYFYFLFSAPFLYENNAVTVDETPPKKQTISIYWLPAYILPWAIIFLLMMVSYHILPTAITQNTESSYSNRFVGERAKLLNLELAGIGIG